MKAILLLMQLNLFSYTFSFVVRKTTVYNPISVDNLERQSSNYALGDIKFTFLANNHYKRNGEVASIGNLIKSIRVPGFNVYHLVFNRDETSNNNDVKSSPKLTHHVTEKINQTDKRLSNAIEKVNFTDSLRFDGINMEPYTENVNNQQLGTIRKDCDGKNWIDEEKCKEETTTIIIEVTTEIDLSNENSTVKSEYDDENYGSISDRSDISPSLLASLVG